LAFSYALRASPAYPFIN